MRLALETTAVACSISIAIAGAAFAQQPRAPLSDAGAGAQCQDKPNLTNVVPAMTRVDYLAGGEPQTVNDDVLMADFNVAVENDGGVEASQSRLQYSADVRTLAGKTAEEIEGTTNIYGVPAGGAENGLVSIMVSSLSALLQPSGEIAGSIVFHVVVDVDNEIRECDETDNVGEATFDLKTEKVVS